MTMLRYGVFVAFGLGCHGLRDTVGEMNVERDTIGEMNVERTTNNDNVVNAALEMIGRLRWSPESPFIYNRADKTRKDRPISDLGTPSDVKLSMVCWEMPIYAAYRAGKLGNDPPTCAGTTAFTKDMLGANAKTCTNPTLARYIDVLGAAPFLVTKYQQVPPEKRLPEVQKMGYQNMLENSQLAAATFYNLPNAKVLAGNGIPTPGFIVMWIRLPNKASGKGGNPSAAIHYALAMDPASGTGHCKEAGANVVSLWDEPKSTPPNLNHDSSVQCTTVAKLTAAVVANEKTNHAPECPQGPCEVVVKQVKAPWN